MISTSCAYGIQAALYLASAGRHRPFVSTHQMGEALGLSPHFLAKVLRRLAAEGLVRSKRGPNGGVALARPADEVSMKDLVLAIDGPALFQECVLGLPACGDQKPCPLHDAWEIRRFDLTEAFKKATVAHMAEQTASPNLPPLPDRRDVP